MIFFTIIKNSGIIGSSQGGYIMAKILQSPSKYIQEANALTAVSEYSEKLGKKALCLLSEGGIKRFKATIETSFEKSESEVSFEIFNGECSMKEIERLEKLVSENNYDIVIGVGGGKIHDTAKAVAYYKDIPVIIVPTIASTDAPCSALSVIYSEEGVFEKYLFLKQNPDMVLVDTKIVANAPVRLLVSGMGDALATYFEARACEASEAGTCAFGTTTMAAQALAKLCYETLLSDGYKAMLAVEKHVTTKAVEKIIEANTLLSGLGFESGGLAGAHAIHNGLTVLEETHEMYHGEKVAFGTIVQLVLENASETELSEVLDFIDSVGLPMTLEDLGVNEIDPEKIRKVAELTCSEDDTVHNMPFKVTADDVYAAIITADSLGHEYKGF